MKAVLYARVSSDLQKKERTIESQITELKGQIRDAGDVLVKEYVDDGYSGARLDRPALEDLRRDVKTPLFDSIYFLNTDRIARDVTYQIIIISEILKHQKQLIINGRDYVENPENKFTLTVLGAVAELERQRSSSVLYGESSTS
jgi:site-specific DNA recombinase